MVPSGRLDIRVGHPVMRLDEEATTEREVRTAPEGGVFLGITWTFGPGDMHAFDKVFGQPLPLKMILTSGGKEYPLAPPRLALTGAESDAYYVAVEGDGEDAVIEVEYAGVTQTLDLVSGKREAGDAKALYKLDPSKYSRRPGAVPDRRLDRRGPQRPVDLRLHPLRQHRGPVRRRRVGTQGQQLRGDRALQLADVVLRVQRQRRGG